MGLIKPIANIESYKRRYIMIYETSKQENGTCDSCGYTSWKYKDTSLPHNEEICLSSSCRYAMVNGRAGIMDRPDWTRFLSTKANPDLTMRKS